MREVAAPLPDSGDRINPNRKTVGAAHTRVGAVCPQTPEGFFTFGGAGSGNRSDVAEQYSKAIICCFFPTLRILKKRGHSLRPAPCSDN